MRASPRGRSSADARRHDGQLRHQAPGQRSPRAAGSRPVSGSSNENYADPPSCSRDERRNCPYDSCAACAWLRSAAKNLRRRAALYPPRSSAPPTDGRACDARIVVFAVTSAYGACSSGDTCCFSTRISAPAAKPARTILPPAAEINRRIKASGAGFEVPLAPNTDMLAAPQLPIHRAQHGSDDEQIHLAEPDQHRARLLHPRARRKWRLFFFRRAGRRGMSARNMDLISRMSVRT